MSNALPILLCADDYALSPAVSFGIVQALEANRLSAVSVMSARPFWPEGAKALMAFHRQVQIGLHLNLTCGAPLTRLPSLAHNGKLPSIKTLIRLAKPDKNSTLYQELFEEIEAQLTAFIAHAGCLPDYLDGHEHCHGLPAIRAIVLAVLTKHQLQGKIWLRDSSDTLTAIITRGQTIPKALILKALLFGFQNAVLKAGFETNFSFAGFSRFDEHQSYEAQFTRYLRCPSRRHLIMCHPGLIDEELASIDAITTTRPQELAFLLSDNFFALINKHGQKLARNWSC